LAAAILSRVRSLISSRSNCANESRMWSTSQPIDVDVSKCCVMLAKATRRFSKRSTRREKSSSERLRRSTL
jgi:hypothetical protein